MTLAPPPGEHVTVLERMIVAPGTGVFRLQDPDVIDLRDDQIVERDELIGFLESPGVRTPVISPFRGQLMGIIARDGERLREGQAVAWLRVE